MPQGCKIVFHRRRARSQAKENSDIFDVSTWFSVTGRFVFQVGHIVFFNNLADSFCSARFGVPLLSSAYQVRFLLTSPEGDLFRRCRDLRQLPCRRYLSDISIKLKYKKDY